MNLITPYGNLIEVNRELWSSFQLRSRILDYCHENNTLLKCTKEYQNRLGFVNPKLNMVSTVAKSNQLSNRNHSPTVQLFIFTIPAVSYQ